MRLQFQDEYLSIDKFDPVEVGDFAVITGVNGSGKTHLLRAMQNGSVVADAISTDDIVLFDLFEFQLKNEEECALKQIIEEKNIVWSAFTNVGEQSPYRRAVLESISTNFFTSTEMMVVESIAKKKSAALLVLSKEDFPNNELSEKFNMYRHNLRDLFRAKNLENDYHAHNFLRLLKSVQCFPHRITEVEFMEKYETSILKEGLIPAQLGKIFMEYRINEFVTIHEEYERHAGSNGAGPDSGDQRANNFSRYDGAAPWDIINEFLNTYTGGKYSITYPPPIPVASFVSRSLSFKPELVNKEKDVTVPYDDLSSGEKVLFMLALCMFKANTESVFPKLLLLDEIDATLHPSMIRNLLAVINDVLLRKGTKVVLATHSPTTVALVPEERIFVVNSNGPARISKMAKNDAIQLLTEGYMTLEDTLKVFDQTTKSKICIISEGNNAEYIKKAISIFGNEHEDQIRVVDTIKDITDKNQLKTMFNFFARVDHSTPIFVVWDPDCAGFKALPAKNNTYPVVLTQSPKNTLCRAAGIESLFDDSHFDESEVITTSRGAETVNRSFDSKKKEQFKARMLDAANEKSFEQFKGLVEHIVSVLDARPDMSPKKTGRGAAGVAPP